MSCAALRDAGWWAGLVPYQDIHAWLRRRRARTPRPSDEIVAIRFDRLVDGLFGKVPEDHPSGACVIVPDLGAGQIVCMHFDRPRPRAMSVVHAAVVELVKARTDLHYLWTPRVSGHGAGFLAAGYRLAPPRQSRLVQWLR